MTRANGWAIGSNDRRAVARRISHVAGPWLLAPVVALLLLLAHGSASAQRVEGSRASASGQYAAEVEVNSQSAAERNPAFARALAQVLGKLTGDRNAASTPGIGAELRRADEYVERYDYRQDEGVSASGAPSFDTVLVVHFNRDMVDNLVAGMGLAIWPEPRPKPVLWLAIDDGSGPRLVGLPQAEAARSTLDRAQQRGFRLGMPNGSAAEQATVGAIWRGDTSAVARASQRYSPPMQLIGKMRREGGGWRIDWTFVDNGTVLSRWTETGTNARQVMATGADGAADALMARYAKRPDRGPDAQPGAYRVAFEGLDSASDYMRLSAYLQRVPVVRGITPVRAGADGVEFELDLVSGIAGFDRMVQGDDVLSSIESIEGQPTYRLY